MDYIKNRGFTLIELMIVVAIITIISAFAIPNYKDYVVRTRIAEGLNYIGGIKPVILSDYAVNGDISIERILTELRNYRGVEGRFNVYYGAEANDYKMGYHRLDMGLALRYKGMPTRTLFLALIAVDRSGAIHLVCRNTQDWPSRQLPAGISCYDADVIDNPSAWQ